MALYAKSGEEQNGVDIIDLGGGASLHAAQCKLKEPDKSLPPGEIQEEVDKAITFEKTFELAFGKYAILTRARFQDRASARSLRSTNSMFEVELFTWDRISLLLQTYPEIYEQLFGDGLTPTRAARMESKMADMHVTIKDGFGSLAANESGDGIDLQIDEARSHLATGTFQITTTLLNRLERMRGDQMTPRHKFRVASDHGAAALASAQVELAAKYLLQAVGYQPEDEQALINEAFTHWLVGNTDQSHTKAEALRERFPASGRLAALWIATVPKSVTVEQLEAGRNAILRGDPEVALALARKALAERAFEVSEKYGAVAKRAPKWSQPLIVCAQIRMATHSLGTSAQEETQGVRYEC